ncbi:hypothetical protein TNCV_3308591 [Trichonephila clavipes]|nr:hypothetical protein TNCV_3308591 [Trichonephila clavipes]
MEAEFETRFIPENCPTPIREIPGRMPSALLRTSWRCVTMRGNRRNGFRNLRSLNRLPMIAFTGVMATSQCFDKIAQDLCVKGWMLLLFILTFCSLSRSTTTFLTFCKKVKKVDGHGSPLETAMVHPLMPFTPE